MNYIATQEIRFFDRRGRTVLTVETPEGTGEYVETAAWLEGGKEALLHFFKLDRSGLEPGQPAKKVTLRYERVRMDTGERFALQTIADAGAGEWAWYSGIEGEDAVILYRFDKEKRTTAMFHPEAPFHRLPEAVIQDWLIAGSSCIRLGDPNMDPADPTESLRREEWRRSIWRSAHRRAA